MCDDVLTTIWKRQAAWSRAADRLKASIETARAAALAFSVMGAVAETGAGTILATAPDWRTACAAIGACLLALAVAITKSRLTPDAIRAWTRARSVSEAIKAEVYTFCAQANPYLGANALNILFRKTSDIQHSADNIQHHTAIIDVRDITSPPLLSHDEYIIIRVNKQIEKFYREKARHYTKRLNFLRNTELLLGILGTLLGVLATALGNNGIAGNFGVWTATVTTLGTSLAAHIAANRYDFIVLSYVATATRLEDLVIEWRSRTDAKTETDWSTFVKSCEDTISVENQSWLVKFTEKPHGEP